MRVICIDNTGAPELIEGGEYSVVKENDKAYFLEEQHVCPEDGHPNTWYLKWHFLPCSEIEEGILEFETAQL